MNTYNRYLGGAGGSTNGDTPLIFMLRFSWQFTLGDGGPQWLEEGDGDG